MKVLGQVGKRCWLRKVKIYTKFKISRFLNKKGLLEALLGQRVHRDSLTKDE